MNEDFQYLAPPTPEGFDLLDEFFAPLCAMALLAMPRVNLVCALLNERLGYQRVDALPIGVDHHTAMRIRSRGAGKYAPPSVVLAFGLRDYQQSSSLVFPVRAAVEERHGLTGKITESPRTGKGLWTAGRLSENLRHLRDVNATSVGALECVYLDVTRIDEFISRVLEWTEPLSYAERERITEMESVAAG